MRQAKWWTPDTLFVVGLGAVMAASFGLSFFVPSGSHTGSALVPAAVLERLHQEGAKCQTITDEDVDNHAPPRC